MKVCFVALSLGRAGEPTSGVGAQVRLLAESLSSSGHSVQVITLGNTDNSYDDKGIKIFEVRPGNLHWYVSRLPLLGDLLALPMRELEYGVAAYRGLRSAEASGAPDIIEGAETGMTVIALKRRKAAIVVRLHGEQYTFHRHAPGLKMSIGVRLSRFLQRLALRRARILISPSASHGAEIARELGSNCPNIRVIPNGVQIPSAAGLAKGRAGNVVLFAGRLDRVKGVTVFLEAAAQVIQEIPDAQFVVAGPAHPSLSRSEIDALINRYSLEKNVNVLGAVSSSDLQALYQRASVVIVPSYYESFGLVALEAMSHGAPVIATRVGGLVEIVEDGVSGVLVPAGDITRTAEATVQLLRDTAARKRIGDAARARAQAAFSIEQIELLNLRAYGEMVAHDNAAPRESAVSIMARGKAA